MFIPQNRNRVVQQAGYSPNQMNFNDWVKYARGAMNGGQAPSAAGFQQYQGPQATQPPGGGKNQQQAAAPVQMPVSTVGRLQEIPMQGASSAPVMSGPPSKMPRNLQYAAALSRTK